MSLLKKVNNNLAERRRAEMAKFGLSPDTPGDEERYNRLMEGAQYQSGDLTISRQEITSPEIEKEKDKLNLIRIAVGKNPSSSPEGGNKKG